MSKAIRSIALILCIALAAPLAAQVPSTINYQGRLLENTADQDAATGTVDITFSLWSEETGGTQVWSETWTGVPLNNGVFSVLLGSNGSPLTPDLFQADPTLWLELEVDGETLSPRQQLGSAPFAMTDDPENELQDLILAGDTLGLTDSTATVDLSPYLDDTDTDEQDLSLSGTTLILENDPTPVDLSGFLDNTDAQTLALSGDDLTISGSGSTVDLGQTDTVVALEQRVEALANSLRRRVFVTSTVADGALGGLNGADALCQSLADAATLGGTYLAWLSDTSTSPLTRFDRLGSFELVDGTRVAESWSDLTDGTLDAAISLTESGVAVAGEEVWTGTAFDGSLAGANHCTNWSATAGSGIVGLSDATNAAWTNSGLGDCATARRLYCFEQSGAADSDDQQLTLNGNSLELTSDDGTDTVDLSTYLDNTDSQTLALSGTTLSISNGNSVELSSFTNTDNQTLSLSGTNLSISNGNTVGLSAFLDNTDTQDLSLSGNTLSLTNGGSVSLSSYLDNTDDQQLSLSGNNLRLTSDNGTDSVNLSSFLDNTDSQNLNNVLAQGNDANNRDITNLDDVDIDKLVVDNTFECDGCVDSSDIAKDTILGNDVTDRIFILHIDCNGNCNDMSMRDACDVIENLRGLTFETELVDVSCVHSVPSTTGNGFVDCDDGTEVHGDNECRAFELRTLGDLPCINGDGTDVLVTCWQTDIAK